MQNFYSGSLLGLLLLLCSSAQAAFDGFYAGLGIGQSYGDYSLASAGLQSTTLDKSDFAWRGFFGYQVSPYWALEAGYTRYGAVRFENMNNSDQKGTLQQHSIELLGRVNIPIIEQARIFAELGAAWLHSHPQSHLALYSKTLTTDRQQLHALWGGGVDVDVSNHCSLGINLRHLQKHGEVQSLNFLDAHLTYHFG